MVLSGVTILCSSGMKLVYLLKKVCSINFFFFFVVSKSPLVHCTMGSCSVSQERKKYADMLWSVFYFQMIVLLTTIYIIYILSRY